MYEFRNYWNCGELELYAMYTFMQTLALIVRLKYASVGLSQTGLLGVEAYGGGGWECRDSS